MCCRYYFGDETYREVKKMVRLTDGSFRKARMNQDIRPSEFAPVMAVRDGEKILCGQRFGYRTAKNQGLVLNARAETVHEKSLFRNGICYRRAVIPAAHFYEWNRQKEKNAFFRSDGGTLYLAGFYDFDGTDECFVILTTAANASMIAVHDRMPLILEREQIDSWLFDSQKTETILRQDPAALRRTSGYEQMTLF